MKEFIVKTNFGHTYRWSPELIATDYADTAIQWQNEEDNQFPYTHEELYVEIIKSESFLSQWFNDYIRSDIQYARERAELVSVDEDKYKRFVDWLINVHGEEE